jgi:hypothetical protein
MIAGDTVGPGEGLDVTGSRQDVKMELSDTPPK